MIETAMVSIPQEPECCLVLSFALLGGGGGICSMKATNPSYDEAIREKQ